MWNLGTWNEEEKKNGINLYENIFAHLHETLDVYHHYKINKIKNVNAKFVVLVFRYYCLFHPKNFITFDVLKIKKQKKQKKLYAIWHWYKPDP